MQPSFFIFACERAGSTLLSALLSQHSQVYVLNDTHAFRTYNRLASSKFDWAVGKIVDRTFRTPSTHVWSERSRLPSMGARVDADTIVRYLARLAALHEQEPGNSFDRRLDPGPLLQRSSRESVTVESMFNAVFEQLTPVEQRQKALVGEKTPVHSYVRPWIRQSFPGAAEIVLTRHPVANVASIYKRHARSLRVAIDLYLSSWEMLRPDRPQGRLIIRYEDLITQPGAVLAQVTRHIGAEAEPVPDTFSYDRTHYIGTTIDPGRNAALHQLLNRDERALVQRRCAPVVQDLYPELVSVSQLRPRP